MLLFDLLLVPTYNWPGLFSLRRIRPPRQKSPDCRTFEWLVYSTDRKNSDLGPLSFLFLLLVTCVSDTRSKSFTLLFIRLPQSSCSSLTDCLIGNQGWHWLTLIARPPGVLHWQLSSACNTVHYIHNVTALCSLSLSPYFLLSLSLSLFLLALHPELSSQMNPQGRTCADVELDETNRKQTCASSATLPLHCVHSRIKGKDGRRGRERKKEKENGRERNLWREEKKFSGVEEGEF